MSQDTSFVFEFAPFKDFAPYEGVGTSDFIAQDGDFKVKIVKMIPGRSKPKADGSGNNPQFLVSAVILDEDYAGLKLLKNVLAGGLDKNKESLGRQLVELFLSAGTDLAKIHANAAANAKMDSAAIVKALEGKEVYCSVQATEFEGRQTSEVNNWTTKQRYDEAKAVGAHRKARRAATAKAAASAATNLGGAPAGAPAGTNGTAGSSTDALPML